MVRAISSVSHGRPPVQANSANPPKPFLSPPPMAEEPRFPFTGDRPRMPEIPLHSGLSELADDYDGYIVDLWGVLHDGVTAFPAALDCLLEVRRRGKGVAILSNAPRRVDSVVARNREMGIGPEHFDAALSSGEVAWQHLESRDEPWYRALGRRCLHIGAGRDQGMREGLDYSFVTEVAEADFLLVTGTTSAEAKVADFVPLLDQALGRDLPLVCANPDLEVIRGGRREICAGALAVYYEERGGKLRQHGKPQREVFETCLDLLGLAAARRVAVIGDSLRTDVAGAQGAGLDAIFITGGIHGEALGCADGSAPDPARLDAFCAAANLVPRAALASLRW